ncbi:DUF2254 family protein [Microbulbifer okhotskensis]|uniref:DUF2254 family protein n=1 Tax=Microbulbifer okhotskensis TaxID=2926617 RepID=UPI00207C4626|nr:DUF2254 family protein [Microbulbifer okhotskensis]
MLSSTNPITLTSASTPWPAPVNVLPWRDLNNRNHSRAPLSVIAGVTITVAGTVFSIIAVALTLPSNQLGPHLLQDFIRDRTTQISLGTFLATYA